MGVFSKILGAGQDKLVKQYAKKVEQINAMEPEIQKMSDEAICNEIKSIRAKIEDGLDPDQVTIRVYALGREHIRRTTGKRAYDVQLIGALALNDGHIAELKTGEGKAHPVGTPIPTPDGWKTVGDIEVGDMVFGPDGKPTKIVGVYTQGSKEIYEVALRDGRTVECADEHLWSSYDEDSNGELVTLSTVQMLDNLLNSDTGAGASTSPRYYLPLAEAVEYSEKDLPSDPYDMGCALADEDLAFDNTQPMPHIPQEYKISSIEQRWDLIQGLMDACGDIRRTDHETCEIRFKTTSPILCEDIMEVLYSLGMPCAHSYDGIASNSSSVYTRYAACAHVTEGAASKFFRASHARELASITTDGSTPDNGTEASAAASAAPAKGSDRVAVASVERTGRFAEQVCFEVDHPTHLFLIGEYVVTHNTLTTNFPILLNAIAGKQVHVVTVNEYLSGRDSELCQEALAGTGVTVGYIYNQQPKASKMEAYSCDVVFGTPSEFGFDYLRDNMVTEDEDKVQRKHDYAIIDEIDSILIDEARTPLIISGAGSKSTDIYKAFAIAVRLLRKDVHYEMDEAKKTISATEAGLSAVEKQLGIDDLYSPEYGSQLPRYLKQALSAQFLYHRDKDYIIDDGEVKIVDPNTGRIMEGRRWSEGLHQAVEAKEGVEIQQENDTLATVTLQNFFRLYDKLSGCTGTAMTEDAEFRKTYGMGVVSVPPNKPVAREDRPDVVYKSVKAKFEAIADKITEMNAKGQPVLVGTASVENSERLSDLLTKRGIKHFTLNAKNHAKEAHIVAQAGRAGAVTIATNMAGRGTDIMLGGNADEMLESYKKAVISQRQVDPTTGKVDDFIPQAELDEARRQIKEICDKERQIVLDAGGLAVIGSERHEARRIDNQLRGRSGRQGDPGYSQFYISLEDDLMRLFGQDRMETIKNFMDRGGLADDMPLDAPMISKAIERAQHQVESMHYDSRKSTLDYDDVLNKQRLAIYAERNMLLDGDDVTFKINMIEEDVAESLANEFCDPSCPSDEWDWDKLRVAYAYLMGVSSDDASFLSPSNKHLETTEDVRDLILEKIKDSWSKKAAILGDEGMQDIARRVLLTSVDNAWKDHLNYMDFLKSGIGMRSYGQRDPLTEYKDEAYKAFEFMVDTMYQSALTSIMRIAIKEAPAQPISDNPIAAGSPMVAETRRSAVPGAKRPPIGSMPLEKHHESVESDLEKLEMMKHMTGVQLIQHAPADPKPKETPLPAGAVPASKIVTRMAEDVVADPTSPIVGAGSMGSAVAETNAGLGDADLIEVPKAPNTEGK